MFTISSYELVKEKKEKRTSNVATCVPTCLIFHADLLIVSAPLKKKKKKKYFQITEMEHQSERLPPCAASFAFLNLCFVTDLGLKHLHPPEP